MPIERKLAAIMFTDIAGYTALSARDENKALALLDTQKKILNPIIDEFNGTLHKEVGDGLLFTFSTVTDAVKCGIKIQQETKEVEDLNLRIGIHEGEITLKDGDVLGDDVNVASRIDPFSAIGGIVISGKVQQDILSLPEFETTYVGTPKLKGVAQKVEIYCITSHGLPKTDISTVSAKLENKSKFNIFTLTGGILTAIGVSFWIAVGVFDVSLGDETEVPSIAILPLDNKGAEEDEFYAYGISSDLISDVASAGLIRVASLNDIEKLEYKTLNNSELSKKLFIRHIAQGTIWKKDSIFQLSMELYDTKTERVIWSERWEKNWDKLTTIKDELADKILHQFKVDTKTDAPTQAINTEAYEYYLRARYNYNNRENIDDIEMARGLLNKAIKLENNLISAKILLGDIYYETGNNDKATEIYISTLKQAEKLGDKRGIGLTLANIGIVYKHKGDLETSLDYLERSLAISEEIGDKSRVGYNLMNIGIVHRNKSDYDKALDYFSKSLKIAEEFGDKYGIELILGNIGIAYSNKGDNDKALDYYKRSLAINEEVGDKANMGYILNVIGSVYTAKGDLDIALDYLERSLAIQEELGDKRGLGMNFGNIGILYARKDDYDKALYYQSRSLTIFEELGGKDGIATNLHNIGNYYLDKGDLDTALDYYKRSLAIREELGDMRGIGSTLGNIGILYFYKSDYKNVEESLEKSLSLKAEIGLDLIWSTTYLYLTYKHLGKEYDEKEIHSLIKEAENIGFELNLRLYELLEDKSYLETAYNQVQEKASAMEEELAQKFLSYPVPKGIVEEWEKVNP